LSIEWTKTNENTSAETAIAKIKKTERELTVVLNNGKLKQIGSERREQFTTDASAVEAIGLGTSVHKSFFHF
jgi:hypothetical protein